VNNSCEFFVIHFFVLNFYKIGYYLGDFLFYLFLGGPILLNAFVSSGDSSSDGSKASPLRTDPRALAAFPAPFPAPPNKSPAPLNNELAPLNKPPNGPMPIMDIIHDAIHIHIIIIIIIEVILEEPAIFYFVLIFFI
jgi:hypothetical protein